jgi:hypothetical protein
MRILLVLTGGFLHCGGCAAAEGQPTLVMEVPAARQMTITVDDQPAVRDGAPASANRLILTLPTAQDGTVLKPTTIEALVETLTNALPPEYRRSLAHYFGFESLRHPLGPAADLRLVDLQSFLFNLQVDFAGAPDCLLKCGRGRPNGGLRARRRERGRGRRYLRTPT